MKIHLTDIDAKTPFKRKLTYTARQLHSENRDVKLRDVAFDLEVRVDPLGYVARYEFKATAEAECVRCGDIVAYPLQGQDWIALRLQPPSEHHLVLNADDMNTKFLAEETFDLDNFVDEVVDLEIPDFPRHEQECVAFESHTAPPTNRPFAGLADLIKPDKNQGDL